MLLLLLLLSLQGLRLLLLRLLRGMNNRQTAIVPPILAGSLGDCHLGRLTPDRSKIKRLLLLLSLRRLRRLLLLLLWLLRLMLHLRALLQLLLPWLTELAGSSLLSCYPRRQDCRTRDNS